MAPSLRHDASAISPVVGTILLVAIAVAMASTTWFLLGETSSDTKSAKFPATQAHAGPPPTAALDTAFLELEHAAGSCMPVADLRFRITTPDGVVFTPVVSDSDGDGQWCVTERLTFEETAPGQLGLSDVGKTVELHIVHLPTERVVYDRLVLLKP